jgi:hypothetical protein
MLLDYALLTAPTPLQAGSSANLTLTISNGSRQLVTVTSIVITLPIGTNAKDLTAGTGFQSGTISGWNLAQSGGALTLTPTGSGVVGADGVVVTIADVAVNDQVGTTDLFIDETAAVGSGSPGQNRTSLPVAKFPTQFSLSDLTATPPLVAYNGSVSLMWGGTNADGATYTLDWPDAPTHPVNVTNVGPYQASNLTSLPETFTLQVSLTVQGQDQPLIVQKQATVQETAHLAISQFTGTQSLMHGWTPPLGLQWQVQLATSLTLQLTGLSGSVDVTGLSGCTISAQGLSPLVVYNPSGTQIGTLTPPSTLPQYLNFLLTASDGSLDVQANFQVEVTLGISQFTASQSSISVTTPSLGLQWQASLATSLTLQATQLSGSVDVTGLSGCTVTANGSQPLVVTNPTGTQIGTLTPPSTFPQSLDFVLTAHNGSASAQSTLAITVLAPSVTEFYAQRRGAPFPFLAILNWSTANANRVTIDTLGDVALSGRTEIMRGTYTINAFGLGPTASLQTTFS